MYNKIGIRRVALGLLLGLLAALAVYFTCNWVGYDLQERVGNQLRYQIINDDYSQVVEIPADGLYQQLPLQEGVPVYGVRLKFSTYGTLYRAGMVMVDVYNAAGDMVAQTAANYQNVFDDVFVDLPFGSAYTPAQDETMTLHIYNEVEWEGPLGLWASEGQVGAMPLYLERGGSPVAATLAAQYILDDSGTWPTELLWRIRAPLCMAAFAAVLLFVGLQAPLAVGAAVVALLLGSVFTSVTPPLVGPDEYTHLAASYEQASRWAGQTPAQTAADGSEKLLVRASDAPYFRTDSGEIGIFAYKAAIIARNSETAPSAELTVVSEADAGQGSGSYLAQSVGILLARARGLNFYEMLHYGRTANLWAYVALLALALCLAPAGLRGLLAAVGLLPMPLQLAATLSPDAVLIGMVLCFVALCMRLRVQKAAIWQLVLLAVLAVGIAPSKAIYLPLIALLAVIPAPHLDTRKAVAENRPALRLAGIPVSLGTLIKVGIWLLAALAWALTNAKALHYAARDMNFGLLTLGGALLLAAVAVLSVIFIKIYHNPAQRRWFWRAVAVAALAAIPATMFAFAHMGGGLTPEQLVEGIQPNGDSIYTFSFGYICRNLPATLKLLLRTLPEQGALWLQGLLGTTLGEPIVYRIDVSWLLGVMLLLALLAAALPAAGQAQTLGRRTRWGVSAIVLAVVAISFVVALGWTPINYLTLFGLQGRYWLPVLPLALLLVQNNRSVQAARELTRPALLVISLTNVLVLLQGVGLYATWQP